MPNIFFIILISLLTLCISFISTKGTLSDLKFKKRWWKILTNRGKLAILFTLAIIGLLIWQNEVADRNNNRKDNQLKIERDKRDSLITTGITNGVDSNRKVLFKDLSEALAKQNLRLDTVSKKLTTLEDSVRKPVIVNTGKKPSFELCAQGVLFENTSYPKLIIPYCGYDDWVKILDVSTYIILIDTSNTLHLLQKSKSPPQNTELTPTRAMTSEVDLRNINLKEVKGFYIYLTGDYTDKNLVTKYPINVAYYYGLKSKNFSYTVGQLKLDMLNFLKRNGYL